MKSVILKPKISEKAMTLAAQRKYVFVVTPKAAAPEVRKELKRLYNVDVVSVSIVRIKGKMKRFGRSLTRRASEKKAIVTLKTGQSIDTAVA